MTNQSNEPVTVIIPTFNRSIYLLEALKSILAQSVAPDRIIVVNDGSTDDTEGVLLPYQGHIEYIFQENKGKPAALNNALSLVSDGWVWVFDDDDVALPEALQLHKNALSKSTQSDFTYSAFWFAEEDEDGALKRTTFASSYDQSKASLFDGLLNDCVMSIPGMLIRARCYHDLGGYDPTLDRAEDYEFFLRLANSYSGTGIVEPTFLRRVHGGTRGRSELSHAAETTQSKFLEYERGIFETLYGSLSLDCYVPGGRATGQFANPAARRRALIKRAISMARKGLWRHAITDLKTLDLQNDLRPLTLDEKVICIKAFTQEVVFEELRNSPGILAELRRDLNSKLLREMKIVMGRGLLSRIRRSSHRSTFRRALDIFVLGKLYGFATLLRSSLIRM